MSQIDAILSAIDQGTELSRQQIAALIGVETKEDVERLHAKAYEIKLREVGDKVYFRGIIEFSNICEKNCLYCGIRHDNENVRRFQMDESEIIEAAKWIFENQYGSLVLQSGERSDPAFTDLIEHVVREIRDFSGGRLRVTLCVGEQDETVYRRWFEAGAHRYLLRIETSNPVLYRSIHPGNHSFERRVECLHVLRRIGYQTGTGVMIGLPDQTLDDLAGDILFFRDMDIDMIGMGPYIVHDETPLADRIQNFDAIRARQLQLGLNMIAVTRIVLKDVNIASTTALQALNPTGREMGLKAGANVIMPNVTDTRYRSFYQLYQGKPCLDENSGQCRFCLERRIGSVGETIAYDEWGDSPHHLKKQGMA